MKKIISLLGICLLTACGGGGGGGDGVCNDSVACIAPDPGSVVDSTPLLGTYDIDYVLQSNSCNGSRPLQNLHEQYEATAGVGLRAVPTIETASTNGLSFVTYSTVDNTDGKTFFTAREDSGAPHVLPNFISGITCSETLSIIFHVAGNGAAAVRTSDISCVSADNVTTLTCQVIYDGNGRFTPR